MKDMKVMIGSTPAPSKMHITVTEKGPYLVYGAPPLFQQFILTDQAGECRRYEKGAEFSMQKEPTSLCRCGHSKDNPYCDGSHIRSQWDPKLTAPMESLLSNADVLEGENLTLLDNEKYCVYARFCHPQGGTWRLAEESGDPKARAEAVRQASLCPAGRLSAWGLEDDEPYEFKYEPSLGLLEDPAIGVSSGLWIKGGILIEREDGQSYEVRNRVVVCRCGSSHNKPYCDGSHARVQWHDRIEEKNSEQMSMQEVEA
ncbi:MAG: CDGSH iron-sulfur domain-containing protein [Rikenellaceae bacterium]